MNISTNMKKLTISHKKSGSYYLENHNLAQRLYKPNVSFTREHFQFSKKYMLKNWNSRDQLSCMWELEIDSHFGSHM
jgi:hypothetical protein